MTNPSLKPLLEIDFLSIDEKHLRILLKDNISINNLLNIAQKSNQINDLIISSIIDEQRKKDECGYSENEISEWRRRKFGERLEETFLDRKRELDAVSFWTLFTKEKGTAIEIFYQLCNQETTFKKLSALYKGVRSEKGKRYSELNKVLARQLRGAGTSKPQTPIPISTGYLITQVIEQHPAQLNEEMKGQLLMDLEKSWAERQLVLRIEEINASINHLKL